MTTLGGEVFRAARMLALPGVAALISLGRAGAAYALAFQPDGLVAGLAGPFLAPEVLLGVGVAALAALLVGNGGVLLLPIAFVASAGLGLALADLDLGTSGQALAVVTAALAFEVLLILGLALSAALGAVAAAGYGLFLGHQSATVPLLEAPDFLLGFLASTALLLSLAVSAGLAVRGAFSSAGSPPAPRPPVAPPSGLTNP